jgi:acyl carrier protein
MDCEEHRGKSGAVGNQREADAGVSGIRTGKLAGDHVGRYVQRSVQRMSSEAQEMIEHILQLIRKPGGTIDENTPLVSSGLIDSMALVDVLVKLEDLTHRRIPAGKVQPKDMDTVAKMFATAERVGKLRS